MPMQDIKGGGEGGGPSRGRPTSRLWPLVVAVALVVAAGIGVVLYLNRQQPAVAPEPAEPETSAPPAAAPSPATPTQEPAPSDAIAPEAAEEAPPVGEILRALSHEPLFLRWVATEDLLRRLVSATNAIADGANPRRQLAFAAPPERMSILRRRDDEIVMVPTSAERFDGWAHVANSVNATHAARAYRLLSPTLEALQVELGPRGRSFEATLAQAVGRLVTVSVPAGDIKLVSGKGASYRFDDPTLEGLPPAEKALVRMGANNARAVQSKLRAIARTIGLRWNPRRQP